MKLEMNDLSKPQEFWGYFQQISEIPRCSKYEEKIREYMVKKAENFGFEHRIDKAGNLFIYLYDYSREQDANSVVLQAHLDMVCEKNENVEFDFKKDGLDLKVIELESEKWITAKGTTLGADNGVGLAYILVLMDRIANAQIDLGGSKIICLCTVDEESGLQGAFDIDPTLISNLAFLINLDSEDDDTFTIGCAGGISTIGELDIDLEKIENKTKEKMGAINLSISGLRGGHSGVDINKGHENAIKLIAKILWKVNNKYTIYLSSVNGGNRPNAIPREAKAFFFFKMKEKEEIQELLEDIFEEIELEIGTRESNMTLSYEISKESKENLIFPTRVQNQLLHMLYVCPNGVIDMHPEIKKLVYTSTNLAALKTTDTSFKVTTSQRSMDPLSKRIIYEKIEALFQLADLGIKVSHIGDYPGWTPNFDSTLLNVAKETYKVLFGKKVQVRAIHAGLECGILKDRFPETELISIGPQIENPHSPDEKLQVKSVEKMWKFIIGFLKNLKSSLSN
ncbi:MAG: beta-Ala-His dipeptidase [Promethearchaeia archaeon]